MIEIILHNQKTTDNLYLEFQENQDISKEIYQEKIDDISCLRLDIFKLKESFDPYSFYREEKVLPVIDAITESKYWECSDSDKRLLQERLQNCLSYAKAFSNERISIINKDFPFIDHTTFRNINLKDIYDLYNDIFVENPIIPNYIVKKYNVDGRSDNIEYMKHFHRLSKNFFKMKDYIDLRLIYNFLKDISLTFLRNSEDYQNFFKRLYNNNIVILDEYVYLKNTNKIIKKINGLYLPKQILHISMFNEKS